MRSAVKWLNYQNGHFPFSSPFALATEQKNCDEKTSGSFLLRSEKKCDREKMDASYAKKLRTCKKMALLVDFWEV